MYKYYNPNPAGRVVGDCAVRAVSKALGITWEEAFDKLATAAYKMADLPNSVGRRGYKARNTTADTGNPRQDVPAGDRQSQDTEP